ncbi:tetratricopeptide repeat protein [Streptomyces mirabilis]|uniref:tetratricopeptide repeat protein n=1 Tax=Streptomyces mirabilis TaxID=68239 RepID=UPI0037F654C4
MAVYKAAGRPTLDQIVRHGKQQRPPASIADSTINGWLNGPAVPSKTHIRDFVAMVAFLQSEATASGSGYVARSEAWWQQLVLDARAERDAARGGRSRTGSAPPQLPDGPVTLPPDLAEFTGRTDELDKLLGWLEPGRGQTADGTAVVVSAAGMAGVGKTALAVHAAHQACARGWFPGGILFANLRGYGGDPAGMEVTVDRFLRALGVKTKDLPDTPDEKLDHWRSLLNSLAARGRPLLAVLDNVRTSGQIARLLAGQPHRTLITSRHNLSAISAYRLELDPLPAEDAVGLLYRTLRAGDTGDERAVAQPVDSLRLAELCGYLPLALRIIGALLRDEPSRLLAAQAAELENERTRLDAMVYEGEDDEGRPLAVQASFELSYRHLTSQQQRTLRLLAAAPGQDVSTAATAALLGQSTAVARRSLAGLARAHLLNFSVNASILPAEEDERWAMHDLIRLFSHCLGDAHSGEDDRDIAVSRLLDHYLATAQEAGSRLEPGTAQPPSDVFTDRHQALGWLELERINLLAAATAPPTRHHPASTDLLLALGRFLERQRHSQDWITLAVQAATVFRESGDHHREGEALNSLGLALRQVRRFDEAIETHTQAAAIFSGAGNLHEGVTLNNLGLALGQVGRLDEAIDAHTRALAMFQETGHRHGEAMALGYLGVALADTERFDEAIEAYTRAITIYHQTGEPDGEGEALCRLGIALADAGRFDDAIEASTRAITIYHETGDRHGEAMALGTLGIALADAGRFDDAIEASTRATVHFRETGDRHGEATGLNNVGLALTQLRQFDDAIEAYTGAIAIFQEIGDRDGEGDALNNLGVAQKARWRSQT